MDYREEGYKGFIHAIIYNCLKMSRVKHEIEEENWEK